VGKLDFDQRASAKVNPQRNAMPEQHGKDTGHADDERESEEVPLLAEKIYVWISKKFHAA
jgi:hypothetical protein